MSPDAALVFDDVVVVRDERPVLDGVHWTVTDGERWVMLGPNGAGKTTIMSLASGYTHPTRGRVEILGHRLGRVDVRSLRERLGITSADVSKRLRPDVAAADVVLTGLHAALETWWHTYDDADRRRAHQLLAAAGIAHLGRHPYRTLSEGERQQVLLARALIAEPELLLLDEPNAGLDLGAREALLGRLSRLAADPAAPPVVLVTHHVEEIPAGFTHALLLRSGRVVAAGPLDDTMTDETLSGCFGLRLRVVRHGERFTCHAV